MANTDIDECMYILKRATHLALRLAEAGVGGVTVQKLDLAEAGAIVYRIN